jgi:hypothetical protein
VTLVGLQARIGRGRAAAVPAVFVVLLFGGPARSQTAETVSTDDAGAVTPVFLEPTIGARFVPTDLNGYFGLFQSHVPTTPEDADASFMLAGDFGVNVHVPLFSWLEVGGGVRVLYGDWSAEPWSPVAYEAVGLELTGHVRFNIWFMDDWATHVPGSGGMDGGIFVELGLGPQIPIVVFRDTASADALFLLRPMAGMIFRFGPGLHWMMGGGYAAAFANDGWDGNPGPSMQGTFLLTGVGIDLR